MQKLYPSLINLLFIIGFSCNSENPKGNARIDTLTSIQNNKDTAILKKEVIKLPLKVDRIIGMTNIELENKYISHTCSAGLMDGDSVDYSISIISSDINSCTKGPSYILLNRFVKHDNDGIAIFQIKDFIKLDTNYNSGDVAYLACYENKTLNKHIISLGMNSGNGKYQELVKVWKINLTTEHFEDYLNYQDIECLDRGYSGDL